MVLVSLSDGGSGGSRGATGKAVHGRPRAPCRYLLAKLGHTGRGRSAEEFSQHRSLHVWLLPPTTEPAFCYDSRYYSTNGGLPPRRESLLCYGLQETGPTLKCCRTQMGERAAPCSKQAGQHSRCPLQMLSSCQAWWWWYSDQWSICRHFGSLLDLGDKMQWS